MRGQLEIFFYSWTEWSNLRLQDDRESKVIRYLDEGPQREGEGNIDEDKELVRVIDFFKILFNVTKITLIWI